MRAARTCLPSACAEPASERVHACMYGLDTATISVWWRHEDPYVGPMEWKASIAKRTRSLRFMGLLRQRAHCSDPALAQMQVRLGLRHAAVSASTVAVAGISLSPRCPSTKYCCLSNFGGVGVPRRKRWRTPESADGSRAAPGVR